MKKIAKSGHRILKKSKVAKEAASAAAGAVGAVGGAAGTGLALSAGLNAAGIATGALVAAPLAAPITVAALGAGAYIVGKKVYSKTRDALSEDEET